MPARILSWHLRRQSISRRLALEGLERRELLAGLTYTTPEDTALVVNDTTLAHVRVVRAPSHGTVSPTNAGGFVYKPALNYFGPDSFTFVLATTSNTATGDIQEASIAVTPVNDAPEARGNEYIAYQNTLLTVADPGVLKNDKDVDNEVLKASVVKPPEHGTLSLNEKGGFTYKPADGYVGTDSFTYQASDGTATSNEAKVSLNVKSLPDARDDQYSVAQNGALFVPPKGVLTNDIGIGDHGLLASLEPGDANQPQHGTVELQADGSFTYKPNPGYYGPDSFVYRATDNTPALDPTSTIASPLPAAFDTAKVWLYVRPSPIVLANNDEFSTLVGTPLAVAAPGVLKNDYVIYAEPTGTISGTTFAPNYPPLIATLLTNPPPAGLSFNADGSFKYEPPTGFQGDVKFSYQAKFVATAAGTPTSTTDTNNDHRDIATVIIHVRQLPDARDDQYVVAQNGVLSVPPKGVLNNDVAIREHGLSASLEPGDDNQPQHGTVELKADGSFTYKPNPGYFGPDSFVYRATDVPPEPVPGTAASLLPPPFDLAKVSIYVQQSPLVMANPDTFTTLVNTALSIDAPGVLRNDRVLFPPVPVPANNANGAISAAGDDHSPILPPSYPLIAALITPPPPETGTLVLKENGALEFVPKTDFRGTVTFTYQAKLAVTTSAAAATDPVADPSGQRSDIATVTIIVRASDPQPVPVARDDSFVGAANSKLSVRAPGVLANDSLRFPLPPTNTDPITNTANPANGVEPNRPRLTAVLVDKPAHGTLTLNANGSFDYVPEANFVGDVKFTYQASWQPPATAGSTIAAPPPILSEKATVILHIVPALATGDTYTTLQNTELAVPAPGVLGNDQGGSNEHPLTAVLITKPLHGQLTLDGSGKFVYVPDPNFTGSDVFVYRADSDLAPPADPTISSADANTNPPGTTPPNTDRPGNVAIVKIYVRAAQSTVHAYPDAYPAVKNTPLTVAEPGVLANDYALVNHHVEASLARGPEHGTVVVNADGSFTYTPATDYVGEDRFTYKATDLSATPGSATGTINVSFALVVIHVRAADAAPPKFLPGDNQRSTDNGGVVKVPDWATLVSLDAGQPQFVVSVDKPELFAAPPTIDATGLLSYAPAPNARGAANVTVELKDGPNIDPATATFTIQVDKPHLLNNTANAHDVTGDKAVAPNDALAIIDYLNAYRSQAVGDVAEGESAATLYYDVDQDDFIAPSDALAVINYLNAQGASDQAEGEYAAATDLSLLALTMGDGIDPLTGKKRMS